MDSMINRYTADRKIRSDDAYTPGDVAGKRPDRAAIVYSQRCREAYKDVPLVLGGIEGSLRRIAHYDYWSDKVRRSVVVDSKCDLLLYGNAERALVEVAHRLAAREPVDTITDVRGTAFVRRASEAGWFEIDSTTVDEPGRVEVHINPYQTTSEQAAAQGSSCSKEDGEAAAASAIPEIAGPSCGTGKNVPARRQYDSPLVAGVEEGDSVQPIQFVANPALRSKLKAPPRDHSVIRLPSYEQVKSDPILYAHANRVLHLETNPGNARALVQAHGEGATARDVWINPPPIPLTTAEMDHVFDLPSARSPHPRYADGQGSFDGETKIPAWEMIRFSVNIMRGCFGGCTFCSITEHEGRVIQNRSADSVLREIRALRRMDDFRGVVTDLGGPTANMYKMHCKSETIESKCRRLSCVHPGVCENLVTDHDPLIDLMQQVREAEGVRKVFIASGVRYDLAERSPRYVAELARHHVGGQLSVAPEHVSPRVLAKMKKPGIESYERFTEMFRCASQDAGKEQYQIPYFISGHPGSSLEDMVDLALWLKERGVRPRQVQDFIPTPMSLAATMYWTGMDPLAWEPVYTAVGLREKKLQKALILYWDEAQWPLVREALEQAGRADLIGFGKDCLVPPERGGGRPVPAPASAPPKRVSSRPARRSTPRG
jgi:uncharacterized radical SAM protein YgiQ